MSDIDATGHELWIPIPLDVAPEALHEQLLERFAGTSHIAEEAAAALVGVARRLADPEALGDGGENLAGWALVEQPGVLSLRGFAVLMVLPVAAGATGEECVAAILAEETLFQEPATAALETLSGEALSLRYRPMVTEDGETFVHQVCSVLWPRPEAGALFMLQHYNTDLVEAAEIAGLLDELGAGISGI